MQYEIEICEQVTYYHTVRIDVPTDEDRDQIVDRLNDICNDSDWDSKDDVIHALRELGIEDEEFIEDGSPFVEIEVN